MNRTATLALALMIVPVALLRPTGERADASSHAQTDPMPPSAQRVMDGWLAALNEGAIADLDAIVADSVRVNGKLVSRARFRSMIAEWRVHSAKRNAVATPFVTDGRVVGIWTWAEVPGGTARTAGAPPSGDVEWLGADFLRVENGRIVEGWLNGGRLGLRTD